MAVVGLVASAAWAQPPLRMGATGDEPAASPFSMDLDSLFQAKVTTASKFAEKLADAPSVMSVVTQDELRRFGGITLREILERVAGLNGFRTGVNDRSIISVRGNQARVNSGHVLLLINGRPTREVAEGGLNEDILESFPVNALERIEVIKGPGSVLYGSDAFSGVINLITRKVSGQGFALRSAGGAGANASSSELFWKRGALQMLAAGQFRQRRPQGGVYAYRETDLTSSRLGQSWSQGFSLADAGVGTYLGLNYKGLSFMSSFTQLQGHSFTSGVVGDLRRKRGFADLGYRRPVNKRWEMSWNVTYNGTTSAVAQTPSVTSEAREVVFEWTNFVTLTPRDRLTFGAVHQRAHGVGHFVGTTPPVRLLEGTRSGSGLYVQHEHRLRHDLKLIGGFQLNKIGRIAANLVPRGGLVWELAPQWTVKALYGQAFRAPSITENWLDFPTLKGNPRLGPERVGTFDLSAGYQGKRLQAGVNYFVSRYTGLVTADSSVFPLVFVNRGASTFAGVEFEAKYYVGRNWQLLGSWLHQRNQDRVTRRPVSPQPGLGAKAGVSYLAESGLTASLFHVYQPGLGGYAAGLNPVPAAQQVFNTHWRVDLTKRWLRDSRQGLALFVHGDNLLNRPVWLPNWGYGINDTLPWRAGRMVLFGIEVWQKQ